MLAAHTAKFRKAVESAPIAIGPQAQIKPQKVAAALECVDRVESYSRKRLQSFRQFLERLSVVDVVDAAEITAAKWRDTSSDRAFRYFCAVCWNKIRAADHG